MHCFVLRNFTHSLAPTLLYSMSLPQCGSTVSANIASCNLSPNLVHWPCTVGSCQCLCQSICEDVPYSCSAVRVTYTHVFPLLCVAMGDCQWAVWILLLSSLLGMAAKQTRRFVGFTTECSGSTLFPKWQYSKVQQPKS